VVAVMVREKLKPNQRQVWQSIQRMLKMADLISIMDHYRTNRK